MTRLASVQSSRAMQTAGKCCAYAKKKAARTVEAVNRVGVASIRALGVIFSPAEGLFQSFRLAGAVLHLIQYRSANASRYASLRSRFGTAEDMIIFFAPVVDLSELVNGEYKKDNKAGFAARIVYFGVDIAGSILTLQEVNMIDLKRLSSAMGRFSVLGAAVQGGLVIGALCDCGDALIQMSGAKAGTWEPQVALANGVAEVALNTFALFSGACTPVMIGLGIAAASTGLIRFLYEHKENIMAGREASAT